MISRLGLRQLSCSPLVSTVPRPGASTSAATRCSTGKFDFKIIQTEHFDVYFYPREREAALDIARMAERSYAGCPGC